MPSWNDGESISDSLSSFDVGNDVSPRARPERILDPDFTGYDDCDLRCKHNMPMYKFVCFEGEDTGRKFLGCGLKVEEMCDKVHWIDGQWPPSLKNSLVKLWGMYEEERDSRIHGAVEYSTKNYELVLEKRELEKKNMELHKSLGNALEHVAEVTTHDLELEKSMRKKAEDTVASLKEEKKKHEVYIADLLKLIHVQKDKMKKISEICGE